MLALVEEDDARDVVGHDKGKLHAEACGCWFFVFWRRDENLVLAGVAPRVCLCLVVVEHVLVCVCVYV